jgi:hypothetical protein
LPTSTGKGDDGGNNFSDKTSTSGLTDTYTITFTDATTSTFTLVNGAAGNDSTVPGPTGTGITSVTKLASGLLDTYTITLTSGSTTTFTVTNGAAGADASNNLQRDASASFTVADADNFVIPKNATDIVITIPTSGLRTKFNGFSRLGTGEVSFVGASGVTLQNPIGYRISRQFDPCYIERDVATQHLYTKVR